MITSLVILLAAIVPVRADIPARVMLFPLVLLPLILMALGLSWISGSLGVFLRNIGKVVGQKVTAFMFLIPTFYPVSAVPEFFRKLFQLNPHSFIVKDSRNVLLWGMMPEWYRYLASHGCSFLLVWLGLWWFEKTRKEFADVL